MARQDPSVVAETSFFPWEITANMEMELVMLVLSVNPLKLIKTDLIPEYTYRQDDILESKRILN